MASHQSSNAARFKGNDLDADADGRVDAADHASNASNADAVDGQNPLRHGEEVDTPASAHHERPQPGANITENADGTWDAQGVSTSEIQQQALAYHLLGGI